MNRARKLLLTGHVATATANIGLSTAGLAMLSLRSGADGGAELDAVSRLLSVNLVVAVVAVLVGSSGALLSPWGLFKYGWVVKKLGLTLAAMLILLGLQLWPGRPGGWPLGIGLAAVLLLSLVTTLLSVYKPGGRLPPIRPSAPAGSAPPRRSAPVR